ncbi:Maf family protein [Thalassoroseus pseudoceratinae]|uniref:Maf family protein n=1 Tax=Thalassoroseus pseudoceratinae TaxID=2713176 RepID=UPI0021BC4969|nr:Maf family protein [Thalassoroseus pseudoceratinae]
MRPNFPVVLGSRSPRRRELLAQLLPNGDRQIEILPPSSSDEANFAGLHGWTEIAARLQSIARTKLQDVCQQTSDRIQNPEEPRLVLTADTVIVADQPESDDQKIVLGQPPHDDWQSTVRKWFRRYLLGKPHEAATAFCLTDGQRTIEQIVRTEVTFHNLSDEWIEWYLRTGEPVGKAGGYAIQDAGSVFVSQVTGSLSNVIGLPQREVLEALCDLTLD